MEVSAEQVQQLAALLGQLLLPDNEILKQAYENLKVFFRDRRVVLALAEILANITDAGVRQLAAVLLRQRLLRSWSRVPKDTQQYMKQLFLARVLSDDKPMVRHAIADIIASIAKFEIAAKRWPDLLSFLTKACTSAAVHEREVGCYLLGILAEAMEEQLKPHIAPLIGMLGRALADPESIHVRVNAFSALRQVALNLDTPAEVDVFRQVVPTMISCLQDFVTRGDDESTTRAFEVLDDLLESQVPVLSKHIHVLLTTSMQIAVNQTLEETTRVHALAFIEWVAEFKPKAILRHKMVAPIVSALFQLITEDEDDTTEEDALSLAPASSQALQVMAANLPAEQVMPVVIQHAQRAVTSQRPNDRKAAMVAVAVVIEGASDYTRQHLDAIVPVVLQGMQDTHSPTRECACFALSELSEHAHPDLEAYHEPLLSQLFAILNNPTTPRLLEKACIALETLVEQFDDKILKYLEPLMEMMVRLLQMNQRAIQEIVICVIGSAAHAAEANFRPWLPSVTQTLLTAMSLTADDDIELRALATDTIGQVATAVGLQQFEPYMMSAMQLALDGLKLDEPRVRECTWIFFSSMARMCASKFESFLPTVMPLLLESAQSNKGLQYNKDGDEDDDMEGFAKALAAEGDEELLNEEGEGEEEEDEPSGGGYYTVMSQFVYEKEMAIAALGEMCLYVGLPFMPYATDTITVLTTLMETSMDGDIREGSVIALGQCFRGFHKMYLQGRSWDDDRTLQVPADTQKLLDFVMPKFVHVLSQETESAVCTAVSIVVGDHLPLFGPSMLNMVRDELAGMMLKILRREAPCQQTMDDDDDEGGEAPADDEEDEQDAENKALFIDTAADVIGAMANVLGPDFAHYFQAFFPELVKFYKPTRPTADRSMALGCITECIVGLKQGATPFAPTSLQLYLRATHDKNDECKRNAAYGLGSLCESVGAPMASSYPQILQALHPLFSDRLDDDIRDNACGAIARMILANPSSIPMEQVLPALLQHLPLRQDMEETEPVLSCLLFLLSSGNAVALAAMPRIVLVFAQAFGPPMEQITTESSRARYAAGLKDIHQRHPEAFVAAYQSLPADYQSILAFVLSN